jgi:hypothetical protein
MPSQAELGARPRSKNREGPVPAADEVPLPLVLPPVALLLPAALEPPASSGATGSVDFLRGICQRGDVEA